MRIAIANDHSSVSLKRELISYIESLGHTAIDFGTQTDEAVDYPDYAKAVGISVLHGEADKGILICGTGIGMSIAANKIKGIRAAVCSEPLSAELTIRHNNSNILCLGARIIGPELARSIVHSYLTAIFEGGRHSRRIAKIHELESLIP